MLNNKWVARIIGVSGVIITICAFMIDNAQFFGFIHPIIAPSYTNAMVAHKNMYKQGFILKQGDIGFNEISEVVKEHIRTHSGDNAPPLVITQIKTIKFGRAQVFPTDRPVFETDFIELEASLQNYPPASGNIYRFKERIEENHLSRTLITWKVIVLAIGTILTTIGIFL
jgi:hypothetical protein